MSDRITLTLREAAAHLELDGITPDRLATLADGDIAALPIVVNGRATPLGDLFTVSGRAATTLVIEGDLRNAALVGARMTAGTLVVEGDVGSDAGVAMSGGLLRINGNAGHRLGAAVPGASKGMSGGEIVVTGSAGNEVGARMRRGLIAIGGAAGAHAGRAVIAGTVAVLGDVGANPGCGSKRGSIVAGGRIEVPSTYRYACTFESTWVRTLLLHLRRAHRLTVDERLVSARWRRYCGDAGDPGKGEILVVQS